MSFFNQKEEVIDIQLTQFGKNSLSRGVFKPVFYRFFDDDILYNLEKGNSKEHQNDTENRILKETPRLKTPHLTTGVETNYFLDDQRILSGTFKRFEPIERNYNPKIQESILIYPLGNKETGTQNAPIFSVLSKKIPFSQEVQYTTGSGITNKIPILHLSASVKITRDKMADQQYSRLLREQHVDLTSQEVVFKDGTRLLRNEKNLLIDIEEVNSFYGLENFEIQLFEILDSGDSETLIEIREFEKINQLFKIKTDEDTGTEEDLSLKNTNYSRRDD